MFVLQKRDKSIKKMKKIWPISTSSALLLSEKNIIFSIKTRCLQSVSSIFITLTTSCYAHEKRMGSLVDFHAVNS